MSADGGAIHTKGIADVFFGSAGKDETSSDEGTKKFAKTDQTVLEVLATRQMTY